MCEEQHSSGVIFTLEPVVYFEAFPVQYLHLFPQSAYFYLIHPSPPSIPGRHLVVFIPWKATLELGAFLGITLGRIVSWQQAMSPPT